MPAPSLQFRELGEPFRLEQPPGGEVLRERQGWILGGRDQIDRPEAWALLLNAVQGCPYLLRNRGASSIASPKEIIAVAVSAVQGCRY